MENMKHNPLVWIVGALVIAIGVGIVLQGGGPRMAEAPAPNMPNASSTPTTTPPVSAKSTNANMYLVLLGDAGKTGKKIGCDDSLVPVVQSVSAVRPLTEIVQKLLAAKVPAAGERGLYNALSPSTLTLESATIENGKATLKLAGTLAVGGACDAPRIVEQLSATALQFSTVKSVDIILNNQPIQVALSAK
jgi:hypothetical protein